MFDSIFLFFIYPSRLLTSLITIRPFLQFFVEFCLAFLKFFCALLFDILVTLASIAYMFARCADLHNLADGFFEVLASHYTVADAVFVDDVSSLAMKVAVSTESPVTMRTRM